MRTVDGARSSAKSQLARFAGFGDLGSAEDDWSVSVSAGTFHVKQASGRTNSEPNFHVKQHDSTIHQKDYNPRDALPP
jgi:hypothetical protein